MINNNNAVCYTFLSIPYIFLPDYIIIHFSPDLFTMYETTGNAFATCRKDIQCDTLHSTMPQANKKTGNSHIASGSLNILAIRLDFESG